MNMNCFLKTAMKAQLLKPEMICYNGHSQMNCMQSIKSGLADVAMMDAGDIYTAGLTFDLVPIISEVYNLGKPEYYVVAVSKEDDPSTDLTYLKGLKFVLYTGGSKKTYFIIEFFSILIMDSKSM